MGKAFAAGLTLLVGIATLLSGVLLAGTTRFRIPAASPAGILGVFAAVCVVAWMARRGRSWAMRTEIAILLATGGYGLVAPTIFEGAPVVLARATGAAALAYGLRRLFVLVRSELGRPGS